MTPQLIITTEGQEIVGPSARHFLSHLPGRGTGIIISGYLRWMELVRRGEPKPFARIEAHVFNIHACDRRRPRRVKTAMHLAEFWLN